APGDSLGIRHRNPESLVASVIEATGLDGDATATVGEDSLPLAEWLATRRELTRLSRPFLAALAERSGSADLGELLAPGNAGFAALLGDHQLIDVLRRWPAEWSADALLSALRPQAQRLYSIASSRKRVGEEAHLTVDILRYAAHGHEHLGAASSFLAALEDGGQVPVYVEPNERFRVPADGSRDIIMVGPGTGVAPFRGFVQERAESGAAGRNWLFFGAQHFNTGFLYQTEWQEALRKGELHRLDLAFSRDQAQKIYVQQRLRERSREVYDWLQSGAHFYVCGAIAMGKDVHAALLDIVTAHNGGDAEAAAEYLTSLQTEGRYGRDLSCPPPTPSPRRGGRGPEGRRGPTASASPPPRPSPAKRRREHNEQSQTRHEPSLRRRHQDQQPRAAGHAGRRAGRPGHRLAVVRGPAPGEVPRQLPAGRPRPARRAPPPEARARAPVHDPHPRAGRRVHARAVAQARRHRHHLGQPFAARHHAADVPVPRRDQTRAQGDDAGDQRRRARHRFGLRRRQPQRAVFQQPAALAPARAGVRLGAAPVAGLPAEDPRLLRDLARPGKARRQRQRGRPDLPRRLPAAQVQDGHRGAAVQRRGRAG